MAGATSAWERGVTGYSNASLLFTGCLAQPCKSVAEQDGDPIANYTAFGPRLPESQHSAWLFCLGLCFYLLLCKAPT